MAIFNSYVSLPEGCLPWLRQLPPCCEPRALVSSVMRAVRSATGESRQCSEGEAWLRDRRLPRRDRIRYTALVGWSQNIWRCPWRIPKMVSLHGKIPLKWMISGYPWICVNSYMIYMKHWFLGDVEYQRGEIPKNADKWQYPHRPEP